MNHITEKETDCQADISDLWFDSGPGHVSSEREYPILFSVDKGRFRPGQRQRETFDFHTGEFAPARWKSNDEIDRSAAGHHQYSAASPAPDAAFSGGLLKEGLMPAGRDTHRTIARRTERRSVGAPRFTARGATCHTLKQMDMTSWSRGTIYSFLMYRVYYKTCIDFLKRMPESFNIFESAFCFFISRWRKREEKECLVAP